MHTYMQTHTHAHMSGHLHVGARIKEDPQSPKPPLDLKIQRFDFTFSEEDCETVKQTFQEFGCSVFIIALLCFTV